MDDPYIASLRLLPARDWLESNQNEYPLASNRHGNTAGALSFVDKLLSLGAAAVFVADPAEEPSRIELEGGPYSDTLVVLLPVEPEKREALFRLFAAEAEHEGFDAPQDTGQSEHLLWWD